MIKNSYKVINYKSFCIFKYSLSFNEVNNSDKNGEMTEEH